MESFGVRSIRHRAVLVSATNFERALHGEIPRARFSVECERAGKPARTKRIAENQAATLERVVAMCVVANPRLAILRPNSKPSALEQTGERRSGDDPTILEERASRPTNIEIINVPLGIELEAAPRGHSPVEIQS